MSDEAQEKKSDPGESKAPESEAVVDKATPETDEGPFFGAFVGEPFVDSSPKAPTKESVSEETPPKVPETKEETKPVIEEAPKKSVESKQSAEVKKGELDVEGKVKGIVESILKTQETKPVETPPASDFEQRYYNTRDWATGVQQQNVTLQDQNAKLQHQISALQGAVKEMGTKLKADGAFGEFKALEGLEKDTSAQQSTIQAPSLTVEQQAINTMAPLLDDADREYGQGTVNEYLFGSAKPTEYKMTLDTKVGRFLNSTEGKAQLREVQNSAKPVVEMIKRVKEWETKEAAKPSQVDLITAQVLEKLGVPENGNGKGIKEKGELPLDLGSLPNVGGSGSEKSKEEVSPRPFGEFLGENFN